MCHCFLYLSATTVSEKELHKLCKLISRGLAGGLEKEHDFTKFVQQVHWRWKQSHEFCFLSGPDQRLLRTQHSCLNTDICWYLRCPRELRASLQGARSAIKPREDSDSSVAVAGDQASYLRACP